MFANNVHNNPMETQPDKSVCWWLVFQTVPEMILQYDS